MEKSPLPSIVTPHALIKSWWPVDGKLLLLTFTFFSISERKVFPEWSSKREIKRKKYSSFITHTSRQRERLLDSPLSSVGEYDIFLIKFLWSRHSLCLHRAGIRTFKDNENLHVREEIGPDLLKAMTDSKISIPIFSKNYASQCPFELAHMVKCQEKGAQMIFPVFYDVDPYNVRHQSGCFEEAFRQHKKKRYDEKTIQWWKDALTKVGQLKGLELKKETDG